MFVRTLQFELELRQHGEQHTRAHVVQLVDQVVDFGGNKKFLVLFAQDQNLIEELRGGRKQKKSQAPLRNFSG